MNAAPLTIAQAQELADRYLERRARFPDEDERQAFLVFLFNAGEAFRRVRCIHGEWSGTKGELPHREGVPLCPSGHPLFEDRLGARLGFVEEVLP